MISNSQRALFNRKLSSLSRQEGTNLFEWSVCFSFPVPVPPNNNITLQNNLMPSLTVQHSSVNFIFSMVQYSECALQDTSPNVCDPCF